MNVLVHLPIDTVVKTWARRLESDGHAVETTFTFSTFLKKARSADCILANATKHDSPRYVWKLLLGLLWARLLGRRIALCASIDPVDLCDRPILRLVQWAINWVVFRCPNVLFLLINRQHMAARYRLSEKRVVFIHNCPDPAIGTPERGPHAPHPLTFLYHGELLWWHGLERFIPIFEEVKKRRPARLIVTGNFYPSVFRVFGFVASRREIVIKGRLAAMLERGDVDYRGRVSLEELRRLMAEADFHVSQLGDEDLQARTELRTCLLEAMAAGMVCLHAPTLALLPDIFCDGENILFVDPRNPRAAADRILELADSPDRLETIGRNAVRTVAEHFSTDRQYETVLAALTRTP